MRFYRIAFLYACFNQGYAVTSPIKWGIGMFGISSLNVVSTMIFYSLYLLSCFFFGWLCFKIGYVDAQNEVNNQYNPFAKEVRKKLSRYNGKR